MEHGSESKLKTTEIKQKKKTSEREEETKKAARAGAGYHSLFFLFPHPQTFREFEKRARRRVAGYRTFRRRLSTTVAAPNFLLLIRPKSLTMLS